MGVCVSMYMSVASTWRVAMGVRVSVYVFVF